MGKSCFAEKSVCTDTVSEKDREQFGRHINSRQSDRFSSEKGKDIVS